MIKKLLFLFLFPLFAFAEPEKPTVLVTIAPYAYFAERIAGTTVHIQTLVPPESNVHIYEPSPKLVQTSGSAQVWFRIQEPFEQKIVKAFQERNKKMRIVNLQEAVELIDEDNLIRSSCGHYHGGKDLHTWVSPRIALQQSQAIANTLIELFPEHKDFYQRNFDSLSADLKELDQEVTSILGPFKGEAILISHPSLGYFCRDYGLLQLSVECEGKDPRPKDVEQIMAMAKVYHIRSVLIQTGFNNQGAQYFAAKLNLHTYRIDPYAKDYLSNIRKIAEVIAQ
ncbi:MAG: zinc ABC transporter substrate-binding protein [Verrucomicrobia bacterium]|nr:zinc ABC transporter substrate-binding protein [Verrucomicrobiota bacterium]